MSTAPMTPVRRAPSRMEEKRRHRDARRTIFLSAAAGVIGVIALGMAVGSSFSVSRPPAGEPLPPAFERPTEPRWHPPRRTIDVGVPVLPPAAPSSTTARSSAAPRTDPAPTSRPRATQRPRSGTTTVTATTTVSEPATTTTVVPPPPPPPPQPSETPTPTPPPDPCTTDQPPIECLPVIPEENASEQPAP